MTVPTAMRLLDRAGNRPVLVRFWSSRNSNSPHAMRGRLMGERGGKLLVQPMRHRQGRGDLQAIPAENVSPWKSKLPVDLQEILGKSVVCC